MSAINSSQRTTLGTNIAAKPVAVNTAHGVSPAMSRMSVGRNSRQQTPVTLDRLSTAEDIDAAAITAAAVNVVNACSEKKAVDTAGAVTAAAGAATMIIIPTAGDRLSHSSREVPPGEADLLGLSHVLILVSTMELLFSRLDMLQGQLDELKSFMSKGSDSRSVYPIVLNGGAAVDVANLTARLSAGSTS